MATKKRLKIILLILAAVLVAALIVGIVVFALNSGGDPNESAGEYQSLAVQTTGKKVEAGDDYVLVAESDTYRLYYYEPRFSIKLENKQTGAVLESTVSDELDDGKNNASWTGQMKSGIVIFAIIGTTNTYQLDMNTTQNEITTWYTDDGIYAEIQFPEYQFSLGVEVALRGDDLVVRVPEGSIKEEKEGTYISTVSLFPFLGYSYLDDKAGYMFIPDGNGALIYLDDKEGRYNTGFSRLIYGNDVGMAGTTTSSYLWDSYETVTQPNDVMAPIFGMAHTYDQIAYLGIVEEGDERCSVECHPNGVMINYNRCFAKFLLRDVFTQPMNNSRSGSIPVAEADRFHSDLTVRYRLLSGEDANYSGMARSYREYLLAGGMVAEQDCSYNTRVDFLGSEREEFLMGTTAVKMTTTDEIAQIYDQLRGEGVSSVLSVYKGWQKGGLYDLPISQYKADGTIGGTHALTRLIEEQKEQDYRLCLYNDALLVNNATNSSTFGVMKMVNKRTYEDDDHYPVYHLFYHQMPSRSESSLTEFAESCAKQGVDSLALAGITDTLSSYSSKGSYYTRRDAMSHYVNALEAISPDRFLALETPNAYLWKYADAFLDMPMGSSDYLYVDQEIPFLAMVLKGIVPMYSQYVNFEANKTENFLQMVESGVYPSFYVTWENSSKLIYTNSRNLYSLEYGSYHDTIVGYDAALRDLAAKTAGARIAEHTILDNGLVQVDYDNGVRLLVNYTEKTLTADGVEVAGLSYKVGESR